MAVLARLEGVHRCCIQAPLIRGEARRTSWDSHDVEAQGHRKASELAFQPTSRGARKAPVIKDRLRQGGKTSATACRRWMARDIELSIGLQDAVFAYQRIRERGREPRHGEAAWSGSMRKAAE